MKVSNQVSNCLFLFSVSVTECLRQVNLHRTSLCGFIWNGKSKHKLLASAQPV